MHVYASPQTKFSDFFGSLLAMCDRKKPLMSPPDASDITTFAGEQNSVSIARSGSGTATPMSNYGAVHAVPVLDVVGSSSWMAEALYRIFEILIAVIGLTLGLPLMVSVALLIRWDSPGPALFWHKRPGRSMMVRGRQLEGRLDLRPPPDGYEPNRLYYVPNYFSLVKFRTMYSDARSRFPELYAYDFEPGEFHQHYGTLWNDPRVTRVGGFLRKLSVDELPNLWSVLAGDMRLVGPRAEAPEVLRYYTPDEMYKFAYKPGITGLAQVNGRGLLNWGETLAWDLKYIRTRTVWLDLKIILLTFKCVMLRWGAF
jgi:lipopolysaccharide/colanic/teichoic acid biosynthesis glycosyltransferase